MRRTGRTSEEAGEALWSAAVPCVVGNGGWIAMEGGVWSKVLCVYTRSMFVAQHRLIRVLACGQCDTELHWLEEK